MEKMVVSLGVLVYCQGARSRSESLLVPCWNSVVNIREEAKRNEQSLLSSLFVFCFVMSHN